MTIILCGLPRSGKSTVGALLAKEMNKTFIDTDLLIEEEHKVSCREFYKKFGEVAFRKAESEVIQKLEGQMVVATGGGSFVLAVNSLRFKSLGKIIYLKADPKILFSRFESVPPYFSDEKGFMKIAREREPLFEMWADVTVNVNKLLPEKTAEFIKESLYGK